MRIQALKLIAFGPFTERNLAFDRSALHIVYGPNEAGKSSALRGLKALLYGIETHTPDNFVHAYGKLRVAGCLRTDDGDELSFVRRKGKKNTLLTPAGEPLDEHLLTPFLQGVTSQLFETLFGIDHRALVQGGEEILAQKGEVGQALFSAALGSHRLHALLDQLDEEAKRLFLPAGSKPLINTAIRSHAQLRSDIRNCSLSSREWDQQRQALERMTQELEAIQSELSGCRREVNRLQRIQRVLPKLARRRELLQALKSMGDFVVLPLDFAQRRQQAVNSLETAQAIVGTELPPLKGLQEDLAGLSLNPALLEQADAVEDLHARLGGHRKALQERPHLAAERRQRLADAESKLREIRPDLELKDIETLRPLLAIRQAITESGSEHAVLMTRMELAASNLLKSERLLKIARRERADIPQSDLPDGLQSAVAAARKQGDLDGINKNVQDKHSSLQAPSPAENSRLTLWDGVLDDVPGVAVPQQESIDRFEAAYNDLNERLRRLEEKKEAAAGALHDAALRLDQIERAGTVPTEIDLADARSGRDRVWQLLRRNWIDGEDVSAEAVHYQSEGSLPDAFEKRVADADELSDRLRREADRVHTLASVKARHEAALRQKDEVTGELAVHAARKEQFNADWRTLWSSSRIDPRTPREMRVWLHDFEKLRDRAEELSALQRKRGELEQTRKAHINMLDRQLLDMGLNGATSEALEVVLLECETLVRQLDGNKRKRDMLDKEIKEREVDMESLTEVHRLATEACEAWKCQWAESMQRIGLRSDASASEVGGYIENVRALFALQGEAENIRIRIQAIDEDAALFRRQVADMAAAIAPELADLPADDAAVQLNSLLKETRSREARRQQIEAQLEQSKQKIQESNATIRIMTERLDGLCEEAKCKNRSELEELERRSADYLGIKQSLASIEQQILEAGEGATVTGLEVESEGTDPDLLPGRISDLRNRIEDELEPKRTELAQARGSEKTKLELMDGSDRAALLDDQAQATLAAIRTQAERYVQVKLAGKILRDQIEHYRKANQGPLLRRASEHFAALTLGSFAALMTDFNEKDEPVLAGVRPGGEKVYVEGMSSGTRDQLYLALRLASLEKYMESSEPIPFIVDDVLVDFDDQRSKAALMTLAALAEKTQVILFTHHSQVVEQAKQLQGPVQVHALSTTE